MAAVSKELQETYLTWEMERSNGDPCGLLAEQKENALKHTLIPFVNESFQKGFGASVGFFWCHC